MSLFKAPLATMVDSINLLNGKDLVAAEYNFGAPTAITPVNGRNTSIVVTAKNQQSAYAGSVSLTYQRRDLSELTSQVSLVVPVKKPTSTADIIAAMNKVFGMVLDSNEIVVRPVTADEMVEGAAVTIAATPTAMAWTGSVSVGTRPGGYMLSDYLTVTKLNGLNYPTSTSTRPYAHFYSYPRDFSIQYPKLSTVAVGTGQLQAVLDALVAETGDAWVLSGNARYSLDGATVTMVGKTADHADVTNVKYDNFIKVTVDPTKCLGLIGEMTLHFDNADINA